MEFGEKLQALRKSRGLTQEELAGALYVSRTAISKWESNRGYPSIDSLKEISAYFSVSIDDLLFGDKKAEKGQKMAAIGSVILSVLAVLLLALAGETYAVVVAFLLLLIKGILLFKGNKNS